MQRMKCLCSLAAVIPKSQSTRFLSVSTRKEKNWVSRVMSGPEGAGDTAPVSASHSSLLADRDALYEIMTHTTKPGERQTYLSAYEDYAKMVQSKDLGVELMGSWRVMIGEANEVVHLWKHTKGYKTSDKVIDAQISDQEIIEALEDQSKLCTRRINTLMLKFAFWDPPQPRPPKHIYEMRSYILQPGQMIEWGNNWARGINFRKDHNQGVGGFFSQMGRLNMVFHFWAYKDMKTRRKIREETWQKPGWDINVMYTVPLIRRMRSRIMVPNSFSPMQ